MEEKQQTEQLVFHSEYSPIHKIVKLKNGKYTIVIADQRHTNEFETVEKADNWIKEKSWEIMLWTYYVINDIMEKNKEPKKK